MLPREEYVEQAYLYRILADRIDQMPLQESLDQVRMELLASTKLPMAVEYLLSEVKHIGLLGPAMKRLAHYFSPFQIFLVDSAEDDRGRFDFRIALNILQKDCEYRSTSENRQGYFFFHFETLCRNRLSYDRGLKAMSEDPAFDAAWRDWILIVRRQLGIVEIADLIYGRSAQYAAERMRRSGEAMPPDKPLLFGEKEGKIAFANRKKDPLLLFAAMQRHLAYPTVPRQKPIDRTHEIIPQMQRKIDRLESRVKLLEEEQRAGIDITKFYGKTSGPRLQP